MSGAKWWLVIRCWVSPMNEQHSLEKRFAAHRTHLRTVAYRMLGSLKF
jgi:DNA-directed RNA polymerase specialized sigma24 family protein